MEEFMEDGGDQKEGEPILVSACLVGVKCRYDGGSKPNQKVIDLTKKRKVILVCPEQLGGLKVPHPPSEQRGNKVFNVDGGEVTDFFEQGAERVFKIAKKHGINLAILKARSPSCGSGRVYDGTFSKTLRDGDGVCAGLLKANGIRVLTEEEIEGIDNGQLTMDNRG